MENNAEREAGSVAQDADAMAHLDAIIALGPAYGPLVDREDHGVTLRERHDFGARLHPRALLRQHEFAAGEIRTGARQQKRDLQRKRVLAVQILM